MTRHRIRLSDLALGIVIGPFLCCWIAVASCFCPGRLHRRRFVQSEDKRRFIRRQGLAPRPGVGREPGDRRMSLGSEEEEVKEAEMAVVKAKGKGKGKVDGKAAKKTFDQCQSPLFRLPLELRVLIYRAVLGDGTFHMVLKERKLGHVRCRREKTLDCPLGFNGWSLSRQCCWGRIDEEGFWLPDISELKGRRGRGWRNRGGDGGIFTRRPGRGRGKPEAEQKPIHGVLALLKTCRMIYSESIPLLYSTNTFAFSDLDVVRHLSATILPYRFSLIRSLDISWMLTWPIYDPVAQALMLSRPALYPPHDEATWEDTWRIISKMPDLRDIRVSLLYFGGWRDAGCEERLLAPLWAVGRDDEQEEKGKGKGKGKGRRMLERFEVHVSWRRSESAIRRERGAVAENGDEFAVGAPFTLIRPLEDGWSADFEDGVF